MSQQSRNWWAENGRLVGVVVSTLTTLAAPIFLYFAIPKAEKKISEKEEEKWKEFKETHDKSEYDDFEGLSKWDIFKIKALYYIPTGLCVLVSIGTNVYTYKLSEDKIKDLTTTVTQLMVNADTTMRIVERNVSKDKMSKIRKDLAEEDVKSRKIVVPNYGNDDGKFTFVEPISGQSFRATADIVRGAIQDANDIMMKRSDRVTLNGFIECLMRRGATNISFSEVGDAIYWEADGSKDFLDVDEFSPLKDDRGNSFSYIQYNRSPVTFIDRR